jgi:hypothetical protein
LSRSPLTILALHRLKAVPRPVVRLGRVLDPVVDLLKLGLDARNLGALSLDRRRLRDRDAGREDEEGHGRHRRDHSSPELQNATQYSRLR